MSNNIFQTERFSSSVDSEYEYSFENLSKHNVFCGGNKAWGESDFFGDRRADDQPWISIQESEPEKKLGNDLNPSFSFELLKKYGGRCRRLNGENMNYSTVYETGSEAGFGLSVETIIQMAAEKFIHLSSQVSNEFSVLSHPYPSSILCHSLEGSQEVQLVQNLLFCAERVEEKLYDRASRLLLECDRMSSPRGTPVQRLVYYFTEALYEKIDRECGTMTPKGLGKKVEDPLKALKGSDEMLIAFHNKLPLSQITKFSGIQAVVDSVAKARKVHFIIFEIRKGVQCTILMQALASRNEHPVEHLKITSVGTSTTSKASIEATGRQLTSFSRSVALKFSFNIVLVDDILDLNESLFELDSDEAIAVYPDYSLMTMLGRPNQLEHLMRLIRTLNPCVMVVSEVDANCNSPIFVDRFVEALFFYGAYFESLSECMRSDEKHRYLAEATSFSSSIRNIVATEGDERKIRHVCINVWRAFFTHFGFEETELSMSSLYQANLVLKNFTCGNLFTLDTDGKSLIIGWKGTPVSSLSAWKLQV